MAAKPIVDGIEQTHASSLIVIRLNVQDPAGTALADRFRFRGTPTFILFDAGGREVLRRVGSIDPQEVARTLSALNAP